MPGGLPRGADLLWADAHKHGLSGAGLALARRFERVFADAEVVVSPSASCVAYLRENGAGLDGRLAELTEFLVDRLGVEDVGATFPHRVTLHPTCHSLRLLGVGDRQRRLVERVRGIDLVELGDAAECCGFGGTFAVKNADTSAGTRPSHEVSPATARITTPKSVQWNTVRVPAAWDRP